MCKRVEFSPATPRERMEYYLDEWDVKHLPDFIVSSLREREFGFDHWGDGPRDRYNSFSSAGELESFLKARAPFAAYTSVSFYQRPEERRGWQGAELVFDIDAKDLPAKGCSCPPGEVCEVCLEEAKEHLLVTRDILREDLGLRELRFVYSGRGYHLRVFDEEVMRIDSSVRGMILDYVSGGVLPREGQWKLRGGYPRVFKERALRILKRLSGDKLREMPGVTARKAAALKKKLWVVANELEEGNFTTAEEVLKKKGLEGFLEGIRMHNTALLDGKVTVDIKRILRLPSSLHSTVSMKCMEVRNIERFDPLRDAVPKFVKERD
jgi:DNA primase small subunit